MKEFSSVDEYIDGFPQEIRQKLVELRGIIKEAAPEATEKISYQIPTFYLYGNLVHYAAFKNHIGFYGFSDFSGDLEEYQRGKGSLHFSIEKPLPAGLIADIVKFRVEENTRKASRKKRKP